MNEMHQARHRPLETCFIIASNRTIPSHAFCYTPSDTTRLHFEKAFVQNVYKRLRLSFCFVPRHGPRSIVKHLISIPGRIKIPSRSCVKQWSACSFLSNTGYQHCSFRSTFTFCVGGFLAYSVHIISSDDTVSPRC